MRWFWIDRFTEFVSGKHASAVKCVSLSEEAVDDYAPGRNFFPSSLIIEGLAQTGGLLACQMTDFHGRVVLAKVQKCRFLFEAYPGDTLEYHVQLVNHDENSAFIRGTSHVAGKLQAEIGLMFAILSDSRFSEIELFEPAELCRMCRLLRLFDVGVHEDGTPVTVPQHFRDAEKAVLLRGY